jgi:hypothetical protein
VSSESGGAGEWLGARITGLEHAVLDFDACRYARRVRPDFDYDLAVVGQPEPNDSAEVPGSEDLIRWRAAEMLHAPLGKPGRIGGMHAR